MTDDEPEYLNDDAPEAVEQDDAKEAIRQMARRGRPPGTSNKYKMRLVRAYWPLDGSGRTERGEIIVVGKDEARAMIACGVGERADPLEL